MRSFPLCFLCLLAVVARGLDSDVGVTQVRTWLTTANQSQLFEQVPDIPAVAGARERWNASDPQAGARIVVNSSERFQTMVGFGAALTDASAYVIYNANESVRRAVLLRLFGPLSAGGIGLNFLRLSIGISDFSKNYAPGNRSYDDCFNTEMDEGSAPQGTKVCAGNDVHLQSFSTAMDEDHYLPIILEILRMNPETIMIASSWTAPLWMKTEHSNGGGTLRPEMFDVYARYLAQYVVDYRARGINIHYLTLQNEPGHGNCGPMPCMMLNPRQAQDLALWFEWHKRSLNLTTPKLLAYDHNWDANYWDEASFWVGWVLSWVPWWFVLASMGFALGLYMNRRKRMPVPDPSRLDTLLLSFIEKPAAGGARGGGTRSQPASALRGVRSEQVLAGRREGRSPRSEDGGPAGGKGLTIPQLRLQIMSMLASDEPLVSALVERSVYIVTAILIFIRIVGLVHVTITERTGQFANYIGSSYPTDLLEMPGGFTLAGVAWHCYGGSPSAMGEVAAKFRHWNPPLEQHMTECSGGDWTGGSWEADFKTDQRSLFIDGAHNYGQSVLRWNLALDENKGPHCSSGACCYTCRPVVTIPSWAEHIDNVTFNQEFYGLAHHSAFLSPGAQRIGTTVSGPDARMVSGVHAVAYRNLDGSLVLVVLSDNIATMWVEDVASDRSFQFSIPPGVATFVWNGSPSERSVVPE